MLSSPLATWPLVGRSDEIEQALDALTSAGGAVLSGVPGVGKSRLAAEVLEVAEARGWATVHLAAGPETVAAPFSPFAPLLGSEVPDDPVARFLRAAKALTARGEHVVVAIDDAHLLDDVSVAFVRHLVTATPVRVLLTLRSGADVPSTFVTLWQAGLLRRIEVLALAREETERLVDLALDGPVHHTTRQWVWDTTNGNPLFAHELVLDALERGVLELLDGRWTLRPGTRGAGSRLREVVAARVGSLDADEREAVELVALGEPLSLVMLEELVGADVVARLDERGLLAGQVDRRRPSVRLAHPLHGEVVRGTMGVAASRARRRRLIDATVATGARRRLDEVRVALWRCEIGDLGDGEQLLAAARELAMAGDRTLVSALHGSDGPGFEPSYGHLEQAATLARGALDGGRSVAAAALLFRLLSRLGRDTEAAAVYDEAVRLASGEADDLVLMRMRTVDIFFGHDDAGTASAVLRTFVDNATDPDVRMAASASLALLTALAGAPDEALAMARTVLESDAGAHSDRLLGTTAAAIGLGEGGRVVEALGLVDAVFGALASDHRTDLVVSLSLCRSVLLASAGRLVEAEALVRSCYAVAERLADGSSMGLFAALASHLALERGDALRASALATEAVDRLADVDPYGVRRIALAIRVHAHALSADADAAAAALDALDAEVLSGLPGSEEQRARAWHDISQGRPSVAVARLLASAEALADAGRVTREAAALHDLVRLGHAAQAVERLEELVGMTDGDVVRTMAEQARAAVEGDAVTMMVVAERWESMSFALFAGEAFGQASVLLTAEGRAANGAAAQARSRKAVAGCGPVATPALAGVGPSASLTRREREIAWLAARGSTDRQIADELVVSIRTVQTHLYNVYAKLGLSGRAELAVVLDGV